MMVVVNAVKKLDGGGVTVEETTPTSIEKFYQKMKVREQHN